MKDKLIDRFIQFDVLLGITALVIALVAAFFSVYGIATLFAGAFVATALMAGALEIGKLVSVTYLYRYWSKTKKWLAIYLSLATAVLMVVTSAGIFGYLSSAYQKSSLSYKAQLEQITMVEKSKGYVQDRISQAQKRIETLNEMRKAQEGRLSEALTNTFVSRNVIQLKQIQDQTAEMIKTTEQDIKTETEKIDVAITEVQVIDQRITDMKFKEGNKDIRTFEFVAKQFNTDLDTVAKWFILTLIFVFDPLAIALILAYNVVVFKKEDPNPIFPKPLVIPAVIETPKDVSLGNGAPIPVVLKIPKKVETDDFKQDLVAESPSEVMVEPISSPTLPETTSINETTTESTSSLTPPSSTAMSDPFYRGMFKNY